MRVLGLAGGRRRLLSLLTVVVIVAVAASVWALRRDHSLYNSPDGTFSVVVPAGWHQVAPGPSSGSICPCWGAAFMDADRSGVPGGTIRVSWVAHPMLSCDFAGTAMTDGFMMTLAGGPVPAQLGASRTAAGAEMRTLDVGGCPSAGDTHRLASTGRPGVFTILLTSPLARFEVERSDLLRLLASWSWVV